METLTKPFQSRVAVSLDRTGMRTSTLGRQAVGDPILVRQLRPGRSLRLAMACQVLAFIEASSRAHVAPVPPGARSASATKAPLLRAQRRSAFKIRFGEPLETPCP